MYLIAGLANAAATLRDHCVTGITANPDVRRVYLGDRFTFVGHTVTIFVSVSPVESVTVSVIWYEPLSA